MVKARSSQIEVMPLAKSMSEALTGLAGENERVIWAAIAWRRREEPHAHSPYVKVFGVVMILELAKSETSLVIRYSMTVSKGGQRLIDEDVLQKSIHFQTSSR